MIINARQALSQARSLARNQQIAEAEHLYRSILLRYPQNREAREALVKLGASAGGDIAGQVDRIVALFGQGHFDAVIANLEPIFARLPGNAALLNLAGAAHAGAGRNEAALVCYDRAVAIQPDFADAHSNRGVALKALGRAGEAIDAYDRALAIDPHFAAAHYCRGNALVDLSRLEEAVEAYERAIIANPRHAEAYSNRGNALQELGRYDEAVASLDQAVALKPDFAEAWTNRGLALHKARRLNEALAAYSEAIRLNPSNVEPIGHMLLLRAQMCNWGDIGLDPARLGIDIAPLPPFALLALEDDGERHLRRSARWAAAKYPPRTPATAAAPAERIRIGYFSTDFYDHATMCLMATMLERHDRRRFEIHAFSFGPDRWDATRRRVIDSVDGFHDVRLLDDPAIAALARRKGIDVAVDLKGYTAEARPGIFACGAAPVQIGWLGYPGSVGADFLDYIIADETVIPPTHRHFYSEKLLALPESYQVNDDRRPIDRATGDRAAFGLTADGFVFCSFNNSYKITPIEFDIWMRVLAQVEGSLLWLLADNEWAMANLRREAAARQVDPARLVFADRLPTPQHLARHRHADLFLDSFACNAHTTASDALWAGLPVLTKTGESFAARVAGSLVRAAGLPELAVDSAAKYERLAIELATDPAQLSELKSRLDRRYRSIPLFDTSKFVRHIEHGFELVTKRQRAGLPPDHIIVPLQPHSS